MSSFLPFALLVLSYCTGNGSTDVWKIFHCDRLEICYSYDIANLDSPILYLILSNWNDALGQFVLVDFFSIVDVKEVRDKPFMICKYPDSPKSVVFFNERLSQFSESIPTKIVVTTVIETHKLYDPILEDYDVYLLIGLGGQRPMDNFFKRVYNTLKRQYTPFNPYFRTSFYDYYDAL